MTRWVRLGLITPSATLLVLLAGLIIWHYPFATDDPIRREDAVRSFYDLSYSGSSTAVKENELTRQAASAGVSYDIRGQVQRFVDRFGLHDASVLDVGSGTGYLQDVVTNYTGLDISRAVSRHYHKRFVAGTATAMPFHDNEFDAVWSIWALEHIPNPEAALREIRRVVKPGGLLFLHPAWDCKPWAADGYEARPFSDFGLGGKLIKASIPLREGSAYTFITTVPNRILRRMFSGSEPTRLHYRRLEPNFTEYWQADADAVNSLDPMEVAMWFESRGDTCLGCSEGYWRYPRAFGPLIIRVNKRLQANQKKGD
jgi:SAM-dependent methyltransferase